MPSRRTKRLMEEVGIEHGSEEYCGVFIHETDKAILFVPDDRIKERGEGKLIWEDKDTVWLPKSKIQYNDEEEYKQGDPIVIDIPEWLAESKELI